MSPKDQAEYDSLGIKPARLLTAEEQEAIRVAYEALAETDYLLRVPANARRLLESLAHARSGQREVHEL